MAGTFEKRVAGAPVGFFAAEAAGLAWLGEATPVGGAQVVEVIAVSDEHIVVERVDSRRPDPEAATAFGAALATTHDAGAEAFGAAPAGRGGPLFIGRLHQPTARESGWGRFYARDRVLVFVDRAQRAGNLTDRDAVAVREACEVVAAGAFDDDDPPARIHGDLWNGNVLWTEHGVVLIDPAAHGGHRETDLAMLDLFGCAHLGRVIEGYESVHPLRPNWRERVPLHQLHPLAVHAVGHGPAYGAALGDAARAVLSLS